MLVMLAKLRLFFDIIKYSPIKYFLLSLTQQPFRVEGGGIKLFWILVRPTP
jgi:hypothetical protein